MSDDVQENKGKLGKWKPKKWKSEYDRIVGYSVLGKQNKEIAVMLGMTPEHVSTILNLPEAIELYNKLKEAVRTRMVANVPEILDYIARKTVERMKQAIDSDVLFEKSPFAVINMGTDVLKGLGHLRGGGNGAPSQSNTQINLINGTPEQVKGILGGLDKADEARRINSKPIAVIPAETASEG